jgi:endonuclease/exonuclease/phosphatase family metal-dependent hydrolase
MTGLRTLVAIATAVIATAVVFATTTLLAARSVSSPNSAVELAHKSAWPVSTGAFSILSYNIKGLPWPIAVGREAAISAIGQRLAAMRTSNVQPHVVLLQEAFGDDAHNLGQAAGYRFVVTGPRISGADEPQPLGRTFAEGAQWLRGEKSGNLIDSGLAILSDYPVLRIERFAFPQGACAGYDCLASKGVLVAWIDVPGAGEPIAVADTHLNARRSTRVPPERADRAYAWQVVALREFLSKVLPAGTPVIFGGDFNTGTVPARLSAVSQPLIEGPHIDGLQSVLAKDEVIFTSRNEVQAIVDRNKDKIFFRDGARVALRPERAWVPFPLGSHEPLSDHAGFVIDIALEP